MRLSKYKFSALLIMISLITMSCEKDISTTPTQDTIYNGTIVLTTEPEGAAIFLNGNNTGKRTPDTITNLEPGTYNVEFRLDPYLAISETISLEENAEATVYKNFFDDSRNYGSITCYSSPTNALISINDVNTGQRTPSTLINLWPDIYKISCSAPEHRDGHKYVTVYGGESKSTAITLQDTSICVDYNAENSDYPAVRGSCVEIEDNGTIWAGNCPGGIVKISNGLWFYINMSNSAMLNNCITCIEFDNNGNRWFGTLNGIVLIDNNDNLTFYDQLNGVDLDNILAIQTDRLGNLYVCSSNSSTRRNLWKYDGVNWTRYDELGNAAIVSLAVDLQNRLWVGSSHGIYLFNDGVYTVGPGNYTDADFRVSQYSIDCLEVDEQGLVWIGTSSAQGGPGGLFVFNGTDYEEVECPTGYFSHINIDRNGNKWICSYGKYPAARFDDTSPILVKLDNNNIATAYSISQLKIASGMLLWSATEANGTVWIASRDKGLIKFKVGNL